MISSSYFVTSCSSGTSALVQDTILGMTSDDNTLVLYTESALLRITLDEPTPRLVQGFKPTLFAGLSKSTPAKLVIVERPWLSVLMQLPEPMKRKVWGT